MAFLVGSFAGGLWNGAASAMSIASAYQNYQQQSQLNDARTAMANAYAAAQGSGANTPPVQDPTAPTTAAIAGGQGPGAGPGPDQAPSPTGGADSTYSPAANTGGDQRDGKPEGPTKTVKTAADGTTTTTVVTPAAIATGQTNQLAAPTPTPATTDAYRAPTAIPPTSAGNAPSPTQPIWNSNNPVGTSALTPQTSAPGSTSSPTVSLTPEQRTGQQALPMVRPGVITVDPSQANTPLNRGALPQPNVPPRSQVSPTQMPTYDVPPGGNAPQSTGTPMRPAIPVGQQGTSPGESPMAPNTAAAPPSMPDYPPSAGGSPATPGQGVGSTILGALKAISPIGSAEAAETPPPSGPARADQKGDAGVNAGAGGKGGQAPAAAAATPQAPSAATPAKPQTAEPTPVAAKVAPGQTGPALQSEQTPLKPPTLNMGPWNKLSPEDQAMLTQVAQKNGRGVVTGPELATVWAREGGLKRQVPDGDVTQYDHSDPSRGPFQIKAGTQATVDHTGTDVSTPEGGAAVAAKLLAYYAIDKGYGAGSVLTHYAYMRGPGAAATAKQTGEFQPQAAGFLRDTFPGADIHAQLANGPSGNRFNERDTSTALMSAAQKGPDAFLNAITETGPSGVPMSQLWRTAQAAAERYALLSGHPEALGPISDLFAQQSHMGALSNLAAADNQLLSGNGAGAAQALAKAHAFFPDGTYGQFGTDSQGNLWGKQFSEATGQPIGKPIPITHDVLARQMVMLQHPNNYLTALQDYQSKNADIGFKQAHAQYYQELPATKLAIEAGREGAAQTRVETQQAGEDRRAANKAPASTGAEDRAIGGEVQKAYGPDSQAYQDATADGAPANAKEQLGTRANIYTELRKAGPGRDAMAGPAAQNAADQLVKGVNKGGWKAQPRPDGSGVDLVDKDGKPHGYLSNERAGRLNALAGARPLAPKAPGQQAMAVGAGAGSPMAATGGYNQSLAGAPATAIPSSTGVPQPQQSMAA